MKSRQRTFLALVSVPTAAALMWCVTSIGQDDGAQQRQLAELEEPAALRRQAAPSPQVIESKSPEELQEHLKSVRRQRVAALREYVRILEFARQIGVRRPGESGAFSELAEAIAELSQAEVELAETREQRIAALRMWYQSAARVESEARLRGEVNAVGGEQELLYRATAARLKAEAALTRELAAKAGAPEPPR